MHRFSNFLYKALLIIEGRWLVNERVVAEYRFFFYFWLVHIKQSFIYYERHVSASLPGRIFGVTKTISQ